jgi:hypothetical protein
MGASEIDTAPGAGEPVNRFAVQALGVLAVAQQRARARLKPERLVVAAELRHVRRPLKGIGP